ncbi:hypothetical protein BC834DRAFT_1045540 [Gloeopeniophorella convolvens]|nr:hypothetical protein BC834DRAFT_1045540 [Gloeopeniophorella convolvens]
MPSSLLVAEVSHIRALNYLTAAGVTIPYWDYILTLPHEVELMWKRPFTKTKTLFLLHRYYTGITWIVVAIGFSGLFYGADNRVCKFMSILVNMVALWITSVCDYAMIIRVHTLWEYHRRILHALLCVYILTIASSAVLLVIDATQMTREHHFSASNSKRRLRAVAYTFPALMHPESIFHMCVVQGRPRALIGLWISQVVFDTILFILILWNAADRPRLVTIGFTSDLFEDGVIFYIVLLVLRVINLTFNGLSNPDYAVLMSTFDFGFSTVASTRLLLGMEKQRRRKAPIKEEALCILDLDSIEPRERKP